MRKLLFSLVILSTLLFGCKNAQKAQTDTTEESRMNKKEKGAVVGASSGAVIGGIIGNKSKNTVLGAIIGAAAGGAVGVIIGNKMDQQAKELEEDLGKIATVERVAEGIKLTFNSQLLFDFGKATLQESNKRDLRNFAETLVQYPDTDLLIVGHTDNVGSASFNQTLSENRAASVSDYLASLGVNRNRLKIQGDGKRQPIVSNDTEENRAQNRRVEIAIYASEKMKSEAKKEVGQ